MAIDGILFGAEKRDPEFMAIQWRIGAPVLPGSWPDGTTLYSLSDPLHSISGEVYVRFHVIMRLLCAQTERG